MLLRAFGSLERVRTANFEELAPYVGPKVAEKIIEYFQGAGICEGDNAGPDGVLPAMHRNRRSRLLRQPGREGAAGEPRRSRSCTTL